MVTFVCLGEIKKIAFHLTVPFLIRLQGPNNFLHKSANIYTMSTKNCTPVYVAITLANNVGF